MKNIVLATMFFLIWCGCGGVKKDEERYFVLKIPASKVEGFFKMIGQTNMPYIEASPYVISAYKQYKEQFSDTIGK